MGEYLLPTINNRLIPISEDLLPAVNNRLKSRSESSISAVNHRLIKLILITLTLLLPHRAARTGGLCGRRPDN